MDVDQNAILSHRVSGIFGTPLCICGLMLDACVNELEDWLRLVNRRSSLKRVPNPSFACLPLGGLPRPLTGVEVKPDPPCKVLATRSSGDAACILEFDSETPSEAHDSSAKASTILVELLGAGEHEDHSDACGECPDRLGPHVTVADADPKVAMLVDSLDEWEVLPRMCLELWLFERALMGDQTADESNTGMV